MFPSTSAGGDFTAADVVHSVDMLTGVDSIQPDADFWDATLDSVVAVDNQTVVFNFNRSVTEDELLPARLCRGVPGDTEQSPV